MLKGIFNQLIEPGATYTLYELRKLEWLHLNKTNTILLSIFLLMLGVLYLRKYSYTKVGLLTLYGLVPISMGVTMLLIGRSEIDYSLILVNMYIQIMLLVLYTQYKKSSFSWNLLVYLYYTIGILYGALLLIQGYLPVELDLLITILGGGNIFFILLVVPAFYNSITPEGDKKIGGVTSLLLMGAILITTILGYPSPKSGTISKYSTVSNIQEIHDYMLDNGYDRVMFTNSTHPENYEEEGKLIISRDAYYESRILLSRNYTNKSPRNEDYE